MPLLTSEKTIDDRFLWAALKVVVVFDQAQQHTGALGIRP